ncbi:MAG TPA: hypothetical protein DCX32_01225 [Candidatus Moranbacteria bacterium]|nr:MAG: hypothetical protein UW87_C0020G0013 [Candidatus Moranbacteria bacterium GW2011_GWC2_45_10]KKT94812.1 MAG: hypothetical protein UW95_C0008G0021 [Parcubacteria group bacterium GW2011_GWC1_45_14]HAV11150.1 hypothetical protein [Candidatus Moranbacteria bacterium]
MTNINLYQSSAESGQRKKLTLVDSGFFWSLSLLLIIMLSFGGLKLVSGNLETKKQSLSDTIEQESAGFTGSDLNRIVDFQARVDESTNSIATKRDTNGIFSALEGSMIKGVNVTSLSYTNEKTGKPKVNIEMTGGDFVSIAKQILSLKENQSFMDVSVQEIARDEKGITFNVVANLK